jgi:uncharacterized protein YcnI
MMVGAGGVGCVMLLTGVGTALAHVDPDPVAVETNAATTVTFNVEHGCDGSPTTKLEFQIPDGVTKAEPVALGGWKTATSDGVVSFTDGSQNAETPFDVQIGFTAPAVAGTIYWKLVQTCEKGEIAWIEIPAAGADAPVHPAPAILVTEGPPTSEELVPATDGPDAAAPATEAGATATDKVGQGSAAPDTAATATAIKAADTVTTVSASSDGSSSNTGVIVGIVIAAVVVIGGGAVLIARRRSGDSS